MLFSILQTLLRCLQVSHVSKYQRRNFILRCSYGEKQKIGVVSLFLYPDFDSREKNKPVLLRINLTQKSTTDRKSVV